MLCALAGFLLCHSRPTFCLEIERTEPLGFIIQTFRLLIMPLAIVLIWYGDAFAYIDPAAGSYFIQLLMAGVLGGLFVTRRFWQGLKARFARINGKTAKRAKS